MDEELIIYTHHHYKESIDRALNIVKDYIQCNQLILVGGMAMDLALRTKGLNIYEDDALPDYDIISDVNIDHAQALGKILCKEGFENVQIVPAVHVTTMRVKYRDAVILDATYVPTSVYQKIPILQVGAFRVIHPNFQKIDQRNSLSFLMEKTGPSHNIFNRMVKDVTRNKILRSVFELETNPTYITKKTNTIQIDMDVLTYNNPSNKLKIFELSNVIYEESPIRFKNNKNINIQLNQYLETNHDICIHGFVAYALLNYVYKQTAQKIINHKDMMDPLDYSQFLEKQKNIIHSHAKIINIKGRDHLVCSIPIGESISFLNSNNHIDDIVKFIESHYKVFDIEKFNRLLEIRPITTKIHTSLYPIEITDLFGRLLSVNTVQIHDYTLFISNYNYILAYFLYNHFIYNDEQTDAYAKYYESLIQMIESIESIHEKYPDTFQQITGMEYTSSPFFVSINTFGKANYHDSYYYYLENFRNRVKEHKNSSLRPFPSYPNPPDCELTNKVFERDQSHYFQIDGQKNNSIQHTNMSHLLSNRL